MVTTTATIKGQITIPAPLRRKFNIRQGTKLRVVECEGGIMLEPLPDDLLAVGRGMLKSEGKIIKALLAERQSEADR